MAWKQTSHPTVQKQRDTWVVRADGIDTVSGARKPRQLGSYPSRRSARAAASSAAAAGDAGAERDTVGTVVDRWVTGVERAVAGERLGAVEADIEALAAS